MFYPREVCPAGVLTVKVVSGGWFVRTPSLQLTLYDAGSYLACFRKLQDYNFMIITLPDQIDPTLVRKHIIKIVYSYICVCNDELSYAYAYDKTGEGSQRKCDYSIRSHCHAKRWLVYNQFVLHKYFYFKTAKLVNYNSINSCDWCSRNIAS